MSDLNPCGYCRAVDDPGGTVVCEGCAYTESRSRIAELESEVERLRDGWTSCNKLKEHFEARADSLAATVERVREPIDSYADLLPGDCTPEEMLLKRVATGLRSTPTAEATPKPGSVADQCRIIMDNIEATPCEYCHGTGYYGDNGPGIEGNGEYHECDQCERGADRKHWARLINVRETATPCGDDERIYPCDDCGTMRTKAEGGTTFTICDACWDKHRAALAATPTDSD